MLTRNTQLAHKWALQCCAEVRVEKKHDKSTQVAPLMGLTSEDKVPIWAAAIAYSDSQIFDDESDKIKLFVQYPARGCSSCAELSSPTAFHLRLPQSACPVDAPVRLCVQLQSSLSQKTERLESIRTLRIGLEQQLRELHAAKVLSKKNGALPFSLGRTCDAPAFCNPSGCRGSRQTCTVCACAVECARESGV